MANGRIAISGRFRDRVVRPGTRAGFGAWQRNVVCYSGLDLVGRLLCNDAALTGLSWAAVGEGLPDWDGNPPASDRTRVALTSEVGRVRLTDLDWRNARSLRVRFSVQPGTAITLREFGLFGGDASARPGSGILFNHKAHDPKPLAEGESLDREIAIELSDELGVGARDLIGQLLAGTAGVVGLTVVGFGTNGAQDAGNRHSLGAETGRVPLEQVGYDTKTHTVRASAHVAAAPGRPVIREVGLFGGDATGRESAGYLVDRHVIDEVAADRATTLAPRFRIALTAARDVAVPDVTAAQVDAARAALAAAELRLGDVSFAPSDQPHGQVLSQDPAAGAAALEGSAVDVVASAGTVIELPNAVGAAADVARAALQNAGLIVVVEQREVPGPPDVVLSSRPQAGARLAAGDTVRLSVSASMRAVVPDLLGRNRAVAELLARTAGFTLADGEPATEASVETEGTVIAQDPAAGQLTSVDRAIRVTSAAPLTVLMPTLIDMTEDQAEAALAAAAADVLSAHGLPADPPGLVIGVRRAVAVAQPQDPLGVVTGHVPAEGAQVGLYSAVEVDVSAAIDRPVPAVVGMAEADAKTALVAAGFAAGLVTRRGTSEVEPGRVLLQDPAANAPWPAGGRVGLVLATPRTVTVPVLVGEQQGAAAETLTARGLVTGAVRAQQSQQTSGVVIAQQPAAGTTVDTGTAVDLDIAQGVPGVVGRGVDEAVATITGAGLVAVRRDVESESPAGLVLGQAPAAGTPAPAGTRVTLDVATPVTVEVPDVTGLAVGDAQAQLQGRRLQAVVARSEDDQHDENTVIAQDPAPQTRVPVGSAVTVTIAVAPQQVPVPGLIGMTPEEAERSCTEAHLTFAMAGETPSAAVAAGLVAAQDPAADTKLVIGKPVRVWLALERRVVIPNLVGLPLAQAQETARRSVLETRVVPGPDTAVRPELVVAQDPVGDLVTTAAPGTVMTLTLGFAMPNLVGLLQSSAEQQLRARGLNWTVRAVFTRLNIGKVTAQLPQPGGLVAPGAQVTITVPRTLGIDHDQVFDVHDLVVGPDPGPVDHVLINPHDVVRPPVVINPHIVRPPIQ